MSKKIFSLLFILFFTLRIGGQAVGGKIIDAFGNHSLDSVKIQQLNSKAIAYSNSDGSFKLDAPGMYVFNKEGYIQKTMHLTADTYYTLRLSINPQELSEVIVNVDQYPKSLKDVSASVGLITLKDIQRSNHTDYAPVLNRTPGIFMQNATLNTNRITIRGIGSRNLFGTSKIRAYFKDIPLTNGSGETTIEDFELSSLSRIEIIKGNGSSIYGAGLGGVIKLNPKQAALNQSALNSEYVFGSFGLSKTIVDMNLGLRSNSFNAIYSNTLSDGYRENNAYSRSTFTANTTHYINGKNELSVLASFVKLKAFIPSSLNEETYRNNPKSAAFTWKQAKGFEDSNRGILGLSWEHRWNAKTKLYSSLFTSFRDAYEPRPFNILKENTRAFGIRSRLVGESALFKRQVHWTFGGEVFNDRYKYSTFENLYQDDAANGASLEGTILSNFIENRNYYNLFAEFNLDLLKNTTLSFGANLNRTYYKLTDNFPVSEQNPDQSGTYRYQNIFSPKIAATYVISENMSLFSNASHGFSPLSANETLLPNGQINNDLKPETGWNFEIGTRGTTLNKSLWFQLSLYRLAIKNLLVSRRTGEDEFIGVNAGKTRHDGLELELNYKVFKKERSDLNVFLSHSLNHFKFQQFVDETIDYSGNDLTGVPSYIFNAGIDFSHFGFYGTINYSAVGRMPINDSNSLYSDSYSLTNLKIGFMSNLKKTLKLNIYLGLNNILDEHYASQILINATSFNGSPPRYYYPGNPFNYFAGCHLNYVF